MFFDVFFGIVFRIDFWTHFWPKIGQNWPQNLVGRPPFFDLFRGSDLLWYFCWFRVHFWRPFGTLWGHFGVLLAQIGSLLVPCRVRFWLFCTLGCSFWFVVGEINLLRQYFAKKYTCIDLASNFLQIFRMQIIFPRPGGGTIAAGNRDSPPGRAQPARGACWAWKCLRFTFPACTLSPQ